MGIHGKKSNRNNFGNKPITHWDTWAGQRITLHQIKYLLPFPLDWLIPIFPSIWYYNIKCKTAKWRNGNVVYAMQSLFHYLLPPRVHFHFCLHIALFSRCCSFKNRVWTNLTLSQANWLIFLPWTITCQLLTQFQAGRKGMHLLPINVCCLLRIGWYLSLLFCYWCLHHTEEKDCGKTRNFSQSAKDWLSLHLETLFFQSINTKMWPINEYQGHMGSVWEDCFGLPHYWAGSESRGGEGKAMEPLMAGHHQQALPLPFLLKSFSLQTSGHPDHHHRRLFPENLSNRLFFENQLTLDLTSLLYKCMGVF